jgi:hypothetical protein
LADKKSAFTAESDMHPFIRMDGYCIREGMSASSEILAKLQQIREETLIKGPYSLRRPPRFPSYIFLRNSQITQDR